ncbi:IS30 family transposase [Mycoplasmopsis arginini]|uniref:IS30 family transposase n=3 Tax=Mycoplasmopsis arginini TaxID=2094 RepID=UPI000764B390|nr:IS30 family transposase [Mycoplasmopsis arginini]
MNYTIKKYNHLTDSERIIIENYLKLNYSLRMISRLIKRSVSTLSREIKRNTNEFGVYEFKYASLKTKERFRHKYYFKFVDNKKFKNFSKIFLQKYDKKFFGIKSTYNFIKTKTKHCCPSLRTVFNWINTNNWVIKKYQKLRLYYKKGGKRTASVINRLVKSADYVFPIWTRPKSIDLRLEFGHWEADLVLGKRANGYNNVLTLTERKTRIGFARIIQSKSPHTINSELKKIIKDNGLQVKTITIDNGIEFEKIGILARWMNIKIYRAEPYASFQRGSNEHWNGILRREFKKGFNFNTITQEKLDSVVNQINNMTREILNWKTLLQMYLENIK